MDMITKTRRRFMSLMLLVTAVIIVVALVSVYWLTYSSLETENRRRLNSVEKTTIQENGRVSNGSEDTDAVVVERITPDIGTNFSMLTNDQGQVLSVLSVFKAKQDLYQTAADIAWKGRNYKKVKLDGRMWQYSVLPITDDLKLDGSEQLLSELEEAYQIRFVDITESQQTLWKLAIILSVTGVGLLLFFFFFSLFISKRAVAPLQEVLEKQQQFVADASHELKTPISIIKANCSVLYANEEETVASQKEWLNGITTGADRMAKLIRNLLTLSKIQSSDHALLASQVHLSEIIQESLDALNLVIKEKALTVEVDCGTETIHSDRDRICQVLNVVLDNAIKYSNNGGQIRISVKREKKWCCLSVFNTGGGIKSSDLEKIFDRFYRTDDARTQDGSYGLGLSIARTIMQQLGGTIAAESIPDQSVTFTLRFLQK